MKLASSLLVFGYEEIRFFLYPLCWGLIRPFDISLIRRRNFSHSLHSNYVRFGLRNICSVVNGSFIGTRPDLRLGLAWFGTLRPEQNGQRSQWHFNGGFGSFRRAMFCFRRLNEVSVVNLNEGKVSRSHGRSPDSHRPDMSVSEHHSRSYSNCCRSSPTSLNFPE